MIVEIPEPLVSPRQKSTLKDKLLNHTTFISFKHDVSELYLRKISHCVIDAVEEHSELSLQDLELKDWEELLPLEVDPELFSVE